LGRSTCSWKDADHLIWLCQLPSSSFPRVTDAQPPQEQAIPHKCFAHGHIQ
jgi:hypothetical protein